VSVCNNILCIRHFHSFCHSETLMPDMARDMPMCMQQYRFLFNSCRVPQTPSDRVRVYDSRKHHHVVVMRQNRIFSFDLMVQSNNGDPREKLSVGAIRRYFLITYFFLRYRLTIIIFEIMCFFFHASVTAS
jgi:carnitine O-acetyltransferase